MTRRGGVSRARARAPSSSASPPPASASPPAAIPPPPPPLALVSSAVSPTPPPPPPPPAAAPRPKIRTKRSNVSGLLHPASGPMSETLPPTSKETLPPTSKEPPPPISSETLLRPPTSPRHPPRRNPPRGASAKRSEAYAEAHDHQRVKSSAVLMPLDVALSVTVQPKIKFVTRHGEDTAQPATAIAQQPTLPTTVPTSPRPHDDKLQNRIQSLTFKGVGNGRPVSGSNVKELAVIYDEEMTFHRPPGPPDYLTLKQVKEQVEVPERLTCIIDKLIEEKLHIRFDLFKPDEAPTNSLLAVHGMDHVKTVESLQSKNAKERKALARKADDVYYCQGSSKAAFLAAGSAIKATTLVVEGMYQYSFAVTRPPGHHAGKQGPSGFCLFNNVAVAAKHILTKYEKKKIVVLDFDIHHGNGTQEIFYDDDRVLFISVHRYNTNNPFYPYTKDGDLDNVGRGFGRGFNVNICLPYKGVGDPDYFVIWEELVLPLLESYGPEMILISAGFDAADGDAVGECKVTPKGYATLLDMLMKFGNLVLVLEGGYDLDALAECASACIKVLSGDNNCIISERTGLPLSSTLSMIKKTKEKLSEIWEIFKEGPKKAAVVAQSEAKHHATGTSMGSVDHQ